MNWEKLLDGAIFILVFWLSIKLIEYQGDYLVDLAGDLFGATALLFLGVQQTIDDY